MPRQYSKLGQEFWALENATVSSYLDIGTAGPINQSATYLLDLKGWEGVCVGSGLDVASYRDVRSCRAILNCSNPFDIDWKSLMSDVPVQGYLNIDIPDKLGVICALLEVLTQGLVFQCATVRHDSSMNGSGHRDAIRATMKANGYHPQKIDVDGVDFWLRYD